MRISVQGKVADKHREMLVTGSTNGNRGQLKITGWIMPWNKNNEEDYASYMRELEEQGITEVDLYINSGGGSVFIANEIYNINKAFKGTVYGHCGALVGSAATTILMSTNRATRVAAENMQMMLHKPSTWVEGNEDVIESKLKLLRNLQKTFLKVYAANSTFTEEEIAAKWKDDWWMTAEEAKQYGFINSIDGELELELDPEETAAVQSSIEGLPEPVMAAVKVTTSNKHNSTKMDKDQLKALGLPENATPEQVNAKIAELNAQADKATKLETQIKEKETTSAKERAEVVVDAAVAAKKITASQREGFVTMATANYEEAKAVLDSMKPVVSLSKELPAGGKPSGKNTDPEAKNRTDWTYENYQENDPKALLDMAEEKDPVFMKLFKDHYGYEFKG